MHQQIEQFGRNGSKLLQPTKIESLKNGKI
jgi:hypothetical protein